MVNESDSASVENVMSSEAPVASPDEKKPIPRRNLTEAFEALSMDPAREDQEALVGGHDKEPFFSPTSVMQALESPAIQKPNNDLPPYEFNLHRDLSRDLSSALISRVSLYAVIHDINKEAAALAANDPLSKEDSKEEQSPLVQAVTGSEAIKEGSEVIKSAMIDEETWLLDAIANRTRDGEYEVQACPPTFLQAMGEKEYENPVHALSGASRTQLWKPSRSWWEAKSGKNPWIEPNSHNKRWRYLWPFIHYHKFLAKCIKKLKRNGADVKHSVSPVAVFLREEVCAVSDHLAAVSLFGSEEWMNCLQHFHGWTDESAEDDLRAHIQRLKLRPLHEPGDVDSPLLRSQIDRHFLNAMAEQRAQLREIPITIEAPKKDRGQPPAYPRSSPPNHATGPVGAASPQILHPTGIRRPRFPAQQQPNPRGQQQYWPNAQGYEQPMVFADNSSVQSGISTESCFAPQYTEYPPQTHMAPPHQFSPYYGAPLMYSSAGTQYHPLDPNQHDMYHPVCPPHHQHHQGWLDPALAPYGVHPYFNEVALDVSPSLDHKATTDKEQKEDHTSDVSPYLKSSALHSPHQHQNFSPYWSHLVDGAAQSLATPAKSPSTPSRPSSTRVHVPTPSMADDVGDNRAPPMAAQPLLLRGYPYGYGHYGARGGYAPPSPATQFMMAPTPTNHNNTLYYGSYSGSYSPGRGGVRRSPKMNTSSSSEPPTPVRKMVEMVSESPSTVETCTETESLEDHTTTVNP
ncbi:hypothetical protein ACA910_004245 [Epithemia clementina (nom. ined.)]